MQHTSYLQHISQLDDPAFLAELARVRQRLDHLAEDAAERASLIRVYRALTEEFNRRARAAWTPSAQPATAPAARPRTPSATPPDDCTRKRLLAIEVLLEEPEEISDGLEAELYALRDRLQALALT